MDLLKQDLGFRPEGRPIADMAKLLPYTGGAEQMLLHRVRSGAYPANTGVAATTSEKDACGIYQARLEYPQEFEEPWRFSKGAL